MILSEEPDAFQPEEAETAPQPVAHPQNDDGDDGANPTQSEDFAPTSPVEADSPEQDATPQFQAEDAAPPEDVAQPEQVETDDTLIEALLVDVGMVTEEETPGEQVDLPQSEPEAPEPRQLSRAERETYDRQRRRFAACGRCGYFVADCRIYLGADAFRDAILTARDGWVEMEGDMTFHRLLTDAYGIKIDLQYDYLDGSCPECRRRFVCATTDDGPTRLKIQI